VRNNIPGKLKVKCRWLPLTGNIFFASSAASFMEFSSGYILGWLLCEYGEQSLSSEASASQIRNVIQIISNGA
jgi:hypothetical protein